MNVNTVVGPRFTIKRYQVIMPYTVINHTYVNYILVKPEEKDTAGGVSLMENDNKNNNKRTDSCDAHQMILNDLSAVSLVVWNLVQIKPVS